jgi:hypothetical protein
MFLVTVSFLITRADIAGLPDRRYRTCKYHDTA